MLQEFADPRFQIRLDDGSVVAHPTFHCVWPRQAGDWIFFLRGGGLASHYVARKKSTGVEKQLATVPGRVFQFIANAQQANLAIIWSQSKGVDDGNIAAATFDFASESWLDFSALPVLDVFRLAGSGAMVNWQWIKNDGGVSGFEGSDPCRSHNVSRVTWKSVDLIEFVTIEPAWPTQFPAKYHLWQRPVSRIGLGPMTEILDSNPATLKPWPVDRNNPTEPPWLR